MQKTAYEMRISDWSSDVCSSDLQKTSANHRKVLVTPLINVLSSSRLNTRSEPSIGSIVPGSPRPSVLVWIVTGVQTTPAPITHRAAVARRPRSTRRGPPPRTEERKGGGAGRRGQGRVNLAGRRNHK